MLCHFQGDILIRVNNVKVTSVRQVNRLIEKSKGDRYQSQFSFCHSLLDRISFLMTSCIVVQTAHNELTDSEIELIAEHVHAD